MDIRGRRHFSQLVQEAVEITIIVEFHDPAAEFCLVQHLAPAVVRKFDFHSRKGFLPRVYQHFPHIIALWREKKHFHLAAGFPFLPVQPGRDNLGVVKYEYISRADFVQNIPEMMVLPGAGFLVQHHQPAGIARFRRFLGNKLLGKVIVEFFKFHCYFLSPVMK